MTTLVKVGIGSAVVAAVFAAVPALKGPINRLKNTANEKLNDEYVVDNYKAEYIKLNEKKIEIKNNLDKFIVEKRVVEKKIESSNANLEMAKTKLKAIGTNDLIAFNQAKDAYESFKLEYNNNLTMANAYSNAIAKLEKSLVLIESNMRKAKANVDTLASKKILVDSIKSVNEVVSNLNGTGDDAGMNIAVEKLDETAFRESIKLEALAETTLPQTTLTEADAKAYLETIK